MKRKKIFLLTALGFALILFLTASVLGEDFFVSPTGNDKNPGTKVLPFATVTHAQQAVRKIIKQGLQKNVRVYLRGGVYRIAEPIVFSTTDSGEKNFSITYAAYENEIPIISGGEVINNWEKKADGSWLATLPEKCAHDRKFRELFINGRRAQRARQPNTDYLRVVKASEDRMSHFFFAPEDIPASTNAEGAELVFIHDWSISRIPINKIDFANQTLYPISKIGRQHFMMVIDGFEKHPRYALENSPSFCDAAGEWCFISDQQLTYLPRSGESMENLEAVVPATRKLLLVQGDTVKNQPVRNLHFNGLVFEHCAFPLPPSGYAGVQATFFTETDWQQIGDYVFPAIEFVLAENCSFSNGCIRHVDGGGIGFGRQCSNCILSGTVIEDVGGNGVMIGEVRGREVDGQQWWESAPEQAASHIEVSNNLIQNCGAIFYGAVGVWVGYANKTNIINNEIRFLPYTGISVGWMWSPQPTPCQQNLVKNNHLHHMMQILSDGGGIYTLGYQPGTMLQGNYIHDVPVNLGRAESNGMFLDEGTTDIVIEDNVIHSIARSPLRFHKAGENLVRHNVLVIAADVPAIRYNNTNEIDIQQINNEIFESSLLEKDRLERAIAKIKKSAGIEKKIQQGNK